MAYLFDEWQELSRFCSENESNDCVILMRRYIDDMEITEYATIISYEDSRGCIHYERGHYNMTLEEADLDFVQRTKRIMNIKEIVYVVTKFSRVDEWCEYESALVGVYDSRQDAYECMQRVWEDILGYANDGDIIHEGQDECYVHANEYCYDYYEYSIRVEKHFV